MSAVPLNLTGGCLCGQFRYEISGAPLAMFECHCRDCQHSSGGPYVPVIYVPKTAFSVVRGELSHYWTQSDAGGQNKRGFCATCGARISGGENEEAIGIAASSLDDPSAFAPQFHINVGYAQPWDGIPDDVPSFDGFPT